MVRVVEANCVLEDSEQVEAPDTVALSSSARENYLSGVYDLYLREINQYPLLEDDQVYKHATVVRSAHKRLDEALTRSPRYWELLNELIEKVSRVKKTQVLYPPEFVAKLQDGIEASKAAFQHLMAGDQITPKDYDGLLDTVATLITERSAQLTTSDQTTPTAKMKGKRNHGIVLAKKRASEELAALTTDFSVELQVLGECIGEKRVLPLIRSLAITPEAQVEAVLKRKRSFEMDDTILESALTIRAIMLKTRLSPKQLTGLKDAFDATGSGAVIEATKVLAQSNLRLVVSVAHRLGKKLYVPYSKRMRLISLGTLGLFDAINRYDPDKGIKFSTYATYWIEQKIRAGHKVEVTAFRLPSSAVGARKAAQEGVFDFTAKKGWVPTLHELSELTGIKLDDLERHLQVRSTRAISLSKTILSDSDSAADLNSVIASDAPTPVQEALEQEELGRLKEMLKEGLSYLPIREKEIIMLRFGIGLTRSYSLTEVGVLHKITGERVRQLQKRAIAKVTERFGVGELFGRTDLLKS
ncbi:sigma-70 family RNA polymerase sigma factor [Oligoflexia bacterium]|nr:sigma-70 family RNA polymerase sigma factor [Oligoflexia bacterium]